MVNRMHIELKLTNRIIFWDQPTPPLYILPIIKLKIKLTANGSYKFILLNSDDDLQKDTLDEK